MLDGGAGGQKSFVIGQDRLNAGLLEHDLREPHMVRGGSIAPRKRAAILLVPGEEGFYDCG
jgi:hypothetical protein